MLISHLQLYFEDCKFNAEQSLKKQLEKRDEVEQEYLQRTSVWYMALANRLISGNHWYNFTMSQYDDLIAATQKYINECDGFVSMLKYKAKYENKVDISETDPILARVKMEDFYKFAKKLGVI